MARSQSGPQSPLSPLLNDIAMMLPFPRKTYHALDDSSVSLDPDTSRLLPTKQRTHHVWVQGRLAPVKSVSIANLRRFSDSKTSLAVSTPPGTPITSSRGTSPTRSRFSNMTTPNRRRSLDDVQSDDAVEGMESGRKASQRNCQPRGYGIGGAGNIRRPTDVIHGPFRSNDSTTIRKHRSSSSDNMNEEKGRRGLRQMLRLSPDRKDKGRAE